MEYIYNSKASDSNYKWAVLLPLVFVIIMEFLVDNSIGRTLSIAALAFAYGYSILSQKVFGKISSWLVLCVVSVILCLAGSFFTHTEYSQLYGIQAFMILFLLVNITDNLEPFQNDVSMYDVIYYVIILFTFVNSIMCYVHGGTEAVVMMLGDGNLTSVWWLICLMLSIKRSNKIGILCCLAYVVLINESRGFLLSLAFLILFYMVKKFLPKVTDLILNINFFYLFIILTVLMIAFSFFWVFVVSANGTAGYHESLNDGSNRLRFIANVNAINHLRDTDNTLFWGVGDGIYNYLGISGETYASHTKMLGVRIVQPHNSIINMMLRVGLVPAIIYMFCLSKLLSKLNNIDNIEYIFSYIISAMFLPVLFSSGWLITWIIVLLIPRKVIKNRKKIKWGNKIIWGKQ